MALKCGRAVAINWKRQRVAAHGQFPGVHRHSTKAQEKLNEIVARSPRSRGCRPGPYRIRPARGHHHRGCHHRDLRDRPEGPGLFRGPELGTAGRDVNSNSWRVEAVVASTRIRTCVNTAAVFAPFPRSLKHSPDAKTKVCFSCDDRRLTSCCQWLNNKIYGG